MPFLSIPPIVKRDEHGDVESSNATSFDAETHNRQLEDIFHYYHVNVHKWAVCQIADICALNNCLAKRMEKSPMGFCNHKLAPEVNTMASKQHITRVLDYVCRTICQCNSSIKTRAMLHRLTDRASVFPCATRRTGLSSMVHRCLYIRPELEALYATDTLHLFISRSLLFETK